MKNINDMRALVFEEIKRLQNNESTPAKLNAIVGGLGFVMSSVKLELEYAKTMAKNPEMPFFDISFEGQIEDRK